MCAARFGPACGLAHEHAATCIKAARVSLATQRPACTAQRALLTKAGRLCHPRESQMILFNDRHS
eukprot:6174534-Pleurochrysis_carterae.AAC.2